jgi:hypothetical protein
MAMSPEHNNLAVARSGPPGPDPSVAVAPACHGFVHLPPMVHVARLILLQLPSSTFDHLLQRWRVLLRPRVGTTTSGATYEREKWEEGAPDLSHSMELPSRGPSIAAGGGRE